MVVMVVENQLMSLKLQLRILVLFIQKKQTRGGMVIIMNLFLSLSILILKELIWVDHFRLKAEFKGVSMTIRPKPIIITSNYTIDECF